MGSFLHHIQTLATLQTTTRPDHHPLGGHGQQLRHRRRRGAAVQEDHPEGEAAGAAAAAGPAGPAAAAPDDGRSEARRRHRQQQRQQKQRGQRRRRRRASAARVRPHPAPDRVHGGPSHGVGRRAAQRVRRAQARPGGGGAVVGAAADHPRRLRHVGAGHRLRHAVGELGPRQGRLAARHRRGPGQLARAVAG